MQRHAAAIVLALCAPALAQSVAFEKYELPNGMIVILHEDHSLPVVNINTWFRVGSKDEPPGRSGFAHLFEHLMFMGTDRVPGNQFDVLMESGGGWNNASTSFDRTNYYSNGPSSLLPTLLWLDADRLEDLGRTMTQEKLDLQRDVVRNERRQTIENAPYGKAELEITAIMFPTGHPYHDEVIGTHEDLEAATVQNVTDFFATFYVPNNASLVVAGDFDPAKAKPLIADLFGSIPRGAEPMHKSAAPVRLDRVVRAVTLDQVPQPRTCYAYHSPPEYADGDAEMNLLAAVLGDGKSSRLYKRLVMDDKLASDVSVYQYGAKLQSTFRIDVTSLPGTDLDRVETVIDEELARLLKSGINPTELEQRKATIELAKLSALQSVSAKADKLNEYLFHWGDPDGFARDLDRYRNATPEAVLGWARRVLTQDARLIMRILPTEPERTASARDSRPTDFPPPAFTPPAPEAFTLKNGTPVMLWSRRDLPLVTMQVLFVPGGVLDPPARAGRSSLAAQMLSEGAGDLSAEEFADAVQSLGATFDCSAGLESAAASLTVVKRNFSKAADLARLALRKPRMAAEDFERVKRLHIEELKQEEDEPAIVASRVGLRLLFGESSPYAWPDSGTQGTVAPLTLEAVETRRKELFAPAHATILIAGDLSRQEAEAELNRLFGDWTGGATRAQPSPIAAAGAAGLRVAIVDRPGAVQTVVRFVAPGVPASDDSRVARRILNILLGGSFTSRLNQNLREKNGYTYGARSSFAMNAAGGWFTAGASVRADATGESIREFLGEFNRLRAGDVGNEEAAKARESFKTDVVEPFSSNAGIVGTASGALECGLDYEAIAADLRAAAGVDPGALNTLAGLAIGLERAVLVLVGDRATILEEIKDLGLPAPVEYTATGEPLGR